MIDRAEGSDAVGTRAGAGFLVTGGAGAGRGAVGAC